MLVLVPLAATLVLCVPGPAQASSHRAATADNRPATSRYGLGVRPRVLLSSGLWLLLCCAAGSFIVVAEYRRREPPVTGVSGDRLALVGLYGAVGAGAEPEDGVDDGTPAAGSTR